MLWLLACAGPGSDTSGDTEDTAPSGVEWPAIDPWDAELTLVVDGVLVPAGAEHTVRTAPAGLDTPTAVSLVLTNHGDDATFAGSWLVGDGWTLTGAPAVLAAGASVRMEATFDPLVATGAGAWPAAFEAPGTDLAVTLVADVPRPLRTVVVGDGGWFATSDDYGLTWTPAPTPSALSTRAHAIAWGGGRFFRGDQGGFAWTDPGLYQWSDDGLTWHDAAVAEDFWPSDCVYGAGKFACLRGGSLTWSVNGAIVVHEPSDFSNLLTAMVYAEDRFVAVGRDGRTRLSDDGIAWDSTQSPGMTDEYHDVVYGDGTFVAVGGLRADHFLVGTSVDGGETWSTQTWAPSQYATLSSVAWANGRFVASAQSNADPRMWWSTDGFVWEAIPGLASTAYLQLGAVNGAFLATRSDGVYRSTDGQTWTRVLDTTIPVRAMAAEGWSR